MLHLIQTKLSIAVIIVLVSIKKTYQIIDPFPKTLMCVFLKDVTVGHIYQKHILEEQRAKQLLKSYKKLAKYFVHDLS